MVPKGKIKTLLKPVGRLFASCGEKGLKTNSGHAPSSHAANANKPAGLNQQLPELRNHHQNLSATANGKETCNRAHEQGSLFEFLMRAFPAFRSFSTAPAPAPLFAPVRSGNRPFGRLVCDVRQQRRTLLANRSLSCGFFSAVPGGRVGARNFSSASNAVFASAPANAGSFFVEQGFRPFPMIVNKAAAFWSKGYGSELDDPKARDVLAVRECESTKRSRAMRSKAFRTKAGLERMSGHKENRAGDTPRRQRVRKTVLAAIDKGSDLNAAPKRQLSKKPRVKKVTNVAAADKTDPNATFRRRSSTKLRTKKVATVVDDVRTCMIFELYSSPLAAGAGDLSALVSELRSNGMRSSKAQAPGIRAIAMLDPSFIENLRMIADAHYQHSLAVAAILDALLRHKRLEVELLASGIRVYMPHGTSLKRSRKLLKRWGIDPDSPHFTLEQQPCVHNEQSSQTPAAGTPTRYVFGLTVSPPLRPIDSPVSDSPSSLASTDLLDYSGLSSLLSSLQSLPSPSPLHAIGNDATIGPWDEPSPFSFAQVEQHLPEPPIVGPAYYRGIEQFLDNVDDLISASSEFGRHYTRSGLSLSSFHAHASS